MKSSLADRLLLIVVLETSALLVAVSLAESTLGIYLAPSATAALLIVAALAIPVAVLIPAFASRTERLTRSIGMAVLALGAAATLYRSHEVPESTILLVGVALFGYADHHARRRCRAERAAGTTDPIEPEPSARSPVRTELGTKD